MSLTFCSEQVTQGQGRVSHNALSQGTYSVGVTANNELSGSGITFC